MRIGKDGDNIADSLAGRGVIGGGDTRWGNSRNNGFTRNP